MKRNLVVCGFTLLEVVMATLIFILILGPFLKNLVGQAKVSEDTEKLQMANKILAAVKEECMAVRFQDYVTYSGKTNVDADGFMPLDTMFYPAAFQEVEKFQRRYRDFEVKGKFKFVKRQGRPESEKSVIFVKLEVTWYQPNKGKEKASTCFMIIDPRI